MEYTLHPYQSAASAKITSWVRHEQGGEDNVVITLAAPTGAGKTIISADIIERLLLGDSQGPGDEGYTILWLSLSPTLNEQTHDKFVQASAELAERSHIIDSSSEFVKRSLEPGHIYFLNPHKLAPSASQYRASNARDIDLWDTLAGTALRAGRKLVVFVDEAHRGTGGTKSSDKAHATLMHQLLSGTGKGSVPMPIVIGVSATPQRFNNVFPDRVRRPYVVDVDDVRASGLVKDKLLIAHPNEEIAADITMLGVAAKHRADMAELWAEHSAATGDVHVNPILVLQIPAKPTDEQLAAWVREMLDCDASLRASNIVHALEGGKTLHAGPYALDYVDPSRIQETNRVKVVLFKDALTTGWDCPRAEVLVSLRGTSDDTIITQLIGRAVRTPLAKRVTGDEELNSVRVYLPHFDQEATERVVGSLNSGDDAVASEVTMNPVRVERNPAVPDAAWDALAALPTWTRPAKTAKSEVDRLMRCAKEIMLTYELVDAPIAAAENAVRSAISTHFEANKQFVLDKLDQYAEVDFDLREFELFTGTQTGVTQGRREIVSGNILDLYKQAKGKLPGSSADIAFKQFAQLPPFDEDTAEARLAVAAIAAHPETVTVIEQHARVLLDTWFRTYMSTLSATNRAGAEAFAQLIGESTQSQQVPLSLPVPGTVRWHDTQWDRHLLAAARDETVAEGQTIPKGKYPAKISSSWEERILDYELESPSTVGWYRNPTGGPAALGIPWGVPGQQRVMYPDFLFFRQEADEVTASIIDPHAPREADTLPKWRALGRYAADNADKLARAWAVIDRMGTDELLFIDLAHEPVRTALEAAEHRGGGETEVRQVFDRLGARYLAG
ncbi:DEAD/DEAH box helicase [Leucobacter sp. HY1910]